MVSHERNISAALSFVSGFMDTVGFIALFGLFTAHVTGNLVLAGGSLFSYNTVGSLIPKLVMLPVYIVGVALSSYFINYKRASLGNLILAEVLFVSCFVITGTTLLEHATRPTNAMISFTASFAVTGMAIQNTYMRKLLHDYAPNTVMTGNLTLASMNLADIFTFFFLKDRRLHKDSTKPTFESLNKVATVLAGFLLGCFFGALLVKKVGLLCCLIPAMLLVWVWARIKV